MRVVLTLLFFLFLQLLVSVKVLPTYQPKVNDFDLDPSIVSCWYRYRILRARKIFEKTAKKKTKKSFRDLPWNTVGEQAALLNAAYAKTTASLTALEVTKDVQFDGTLRSCSVLAVALNLLDPFRCVQSRCLSSGRKTPCIPLSLRSRARACCRAPRPHRSRSPAWCCAATRPAAGKWSSALRRLTFSVFYSVCSA